MAQIKTKFLEDAAITSAKINDGAITSAKLNATLDLPSGATRNGNAILDAADKAVANGVASLDGSGKLPSAQLPSSAMEYKGSHDVSTNSPTLIDGTGDNGDMYKVSVAGTRDYGSGNITLAAGDALIYNGSVWEKIPGEDLVQSVAGKQGVITLDTSDVSEDPSNLYYTQARFDSAFTAKSTSDLSEGSNLYFTDARAKAAAVADSITDAVTDVAPSQNAVFDALALKAASADLASNANALGASLIGIEDSAGDFTATEVEGALAELKSDIAAATGSTPAIENFTLSAGQITAQAVTLANAPIGNIARVAVSGINQTYGVDYSVSGTTLSFLGDLATGGDAALVAADVLEVQYEH